MRAAFPEQLQNLLETDELVIIVDRSDDVALLIGKMMKMGLQEVLDKHIPSHWKQRELSWGWTTVIWLAYIASLRRSSKSIRKKLYYGYAKHVESGDGAKSRSLRFY